MLQNDVWKMFPGVEDAIMIHSNCDKPIGENTIKSFCKGLVRDYNMTKWMKCTNHSFCQYDISKLHPLPDISMDESMALSRHKSVEVHRSYIRAINNTEIF